MRVDSPAAGRDIGGVELRRSHLAPTSASLGNRIACPLGHRHLLPHADKRWSSEDWHAQQLPSLQPAFRQKTSQVSGCSASAEAARISVTALLELAEWCRKRCLENQGGDRCQATMATESRLKRGATTSSAEQPLGATARGGPTGDRPNSGRDDGSPDSSSTKEGGIA